MHTSGPAATHAPTWAEAPALLLRVVSALAIALGGYLHFRVWSQGYRHAPVRELFVLNAAVSLIVAVGLLAGYRLACLAGLALSVASLAAFALSRTVGLPTLHGSFTEVGLEPADIRFVGLPAALAVLVSEGVATLLCLATIVRGLRRPTVSRGGAMAMTSRRKPPTTKWPHSRRARHRMGRPEESSTRRRRLLSPRLLRGPQR